MQTSQHNMCKLVVKIDNVFKFGRNLFSKFKSFHFQQNNLITTDFESRQWPLMEKQ